MDFNISASAYSRYPTHGVDVAAKESIYQSIRELSQKNLSLIFISDEETEVLNNCDRILVMKMAR